RKTGWFDKKSSVRLNDRPCHMSGVVDLAAHVKAVSSLECTGRRRFIATNSAKLESPARKAPRKE
ncbi:MAG: hypothetical protein ACM3SP_16655, partial [Chloroflexota bacterium]